MPWIAKAICDICGAERRQANHWWEAMLDNEGDVSSIEIFPLQTGVNETPDDFQFFQSSGAFLLCGEQCVHAAVTRYLAGEPIDGKR